MQKLISVTAVAVVAVLALAACSGGSKNSSSSSTTTTTTGASPAASASMAASSPAAASTSGAMSGAMKSAMTGGTATLGATVYTTNCASCHQANGKGQAGVFPPLAGNAVVTGPATGVIHIVKDGLNGKVVVAGTTYNGQMPAWKGTLKDSEIAAVVTYIRSAWGNKAPAVTTAQVTAAK